MARNVHWSHDPSLSHLRKAPKWYQRRTTPFYISRPSAKMEKQAAEEAERQWASAGIGNCSSRRDCVKASLVPWAVYARTSARLRSALGGHDSINIVDVGCCNSDCMTLICCFPFYGILIAKLQNTVRAFYDLEGSQVRDYLDGCCCPGYTLLRAESEIIFREDKHGQLREAHEPDYPSENAYKTQPPMESVPTPALQNFGPPRARSSSASSSKGKENERNQGPLSTIPEASREASGAGVNSDAGPSQTPVKRAAQLHSLKDDHLVTIPVQLHTLSDDHTVPIPIQLHALSDDHTVPTSVLPHSLDKDDTLPLSVSTGSFPLLKYLNKQWFLVPADGDKENTKPDEPLVEVPEDIPVPSKSAGRSFQRLFRRGGSKAADGSKTAKKPTSKHALADNERPPQAGKESGGSKAATKHVISDDERSTQDGAIQCTHGLVEDPTTVKSHGSRFAEHLLEHDEVSPSTIPTINVSHQLADDPIFTLGSPGAAKHGLSEHVALPTIPKAASSHTLDDDEPPAGVPTPTLIVTPTPAPSEATEQDSPGEDKGPVTSYFSGINQSTGGPQDSGEAGQAQAGQDGDKTTGTGKVLSHELADDLIASGP